jgi:hypothetical protein
MCSHTTHSFSAKGRNLKFLSDTFFVIEDEIHLSYCLCIFLKRFIAQSIYRVYKDKLHNFSCNKFE